MSGEEPPFEGDREAGEPVKEIAGLLETPSSGFLARIRGGIQNRLSLAHVLDFVFTMTLRFLNEVGAAVFGLLEQKRRPRGDSES